MEKAGWRQVRVQWNVVLKVVLLLVVFCPIAFVLGAYGTGYVYAQWANVHYKNSHDGQLGLAVMVYGAMGGAFFTLLTAFLLVITQRKKLASIPHDLDLRGAAPGTQELKL